MDQTLTQFWQRKPIQVKAWRYIDPSDMSNLPDWLVEGINKEYVYFDPRGHIVLIATHRVNLGDWIVYDPRHHWIDAVDIYTNEKFCELYEPAPIGMIRHANEINGPREQQSSLLSGHRDDGSNIGIPRDHSDGVATTGQQS
jgi:hypothetical protein